MPSSAVQTPLSREQLLLVLHAHLSEWRQRYQLQRIGLFGSTARNEATAQSDVDVWVELDPFTPFATVHRKQELEELPHREMPVVRLTPPASSAAMHARPWEMLCGSGELAMEPEESVLEAGSFDALR